MSYSVNWSDRAFTAATRFLGDDPEGLAQVLATTDQLADEPRPDGSVPYGTENLRRLRIGRYRVVYEFHPAEAIVEIMNLGRVS